MPGVYAEHFTTWCGGHGDYDRKHGGLHGTDRASLLRIIIIGRQITNGKLTSPLLYSMSFGHHLRVVSFSSKPRLVQLLNRTPGQDKQPRADLPGRERLGGVIPSGPTAAGVSITRGFSLMACRTANLFWFPAHCLCHLERALVQHSISQMTIRHRAVATAHTVANGQSLGNWGSDVAKEEQRGRGGQATISSSSLRVIIAYLGRLGSIRRRQNHPPLTLKGPGARRAASGESKGGGMVAHYL
ncbi:hypothetical protein PspLS_01607 [Pyricularia sp. CBS 133598]|nr:hypothetical protein PspLS_01607 [Pyricularia sp. CBS 133598]